MITSGETSPTRFARAVGWARLAPTKRVGGPVAAVALAVSGIFGGWAPVQASYDDAGDGALVHSGPFDVSVQRLRAIDDLKPILTPADGNRLLVVIVKARNTTDEPVSGAGLLEHDLTIEPEGAQVDATQSRRLISTKDFSDVKDLQPGLTYELGIVVETKGPAVATRARIGIPGYTWREDSFTPGYFDWKDPQIIARGTYPVKDVPPEPQEEGS